MTGKNCDGFLECNLLSIGSVNLSFFFFSSYSSWAFYIRFYYIVDCCFCVCCFCHILCKSWFCSKVTAFVLTFMFTVVKHCFRFFFDELQLNNIRPFYVFNHDMRLFEMLVFIIRIIWILSNIWLMFNCLKRLILIVNGWFLISHDRV